MPIKVEGLRELQKALRQTPARLDKEMKKAGRAAVKKAIVPPVRSGAPVGKTGKLGRSVRALGSATKAVLAVGSNRAVPYAGVINFGWEARNISAQEFVYKGIDKGTPEMMSIYLEYVDRAVAPAFPE
jgi:hypothetical protein